MSEFNDQASRRTAVDGKKGGRLFADSDVCFSELGCQRHPDYLDRRQRMSIEEKRVTEHVDIATVAGGDEHSQTIASNWGRRKRGVRKKTLTRPGQEHTEQYTLDHMFLSSTHIIVPHGTEDKRMKTRKQGFTLIEILIVVIILGILAAIVIPQFTEASSDAKESSLVSNLQTLRGQMGLYKVQHNDTYPDSIDAIVANFESRLTGRTDVDGVIDPAGEYGPYMQAIPANPFITADVAKFALSALGGAAPVVGTDLSHWVFDTDTGNIWANDSKANADGDNHSTL
jgi:general secretion pathway protein G